MRNKMEIIDEDKFMMKEVILRRLIMSIYIFREHKRIFWNMHDCFHYSSYNKIKTIRNFHGK